MTEANEYLKELSNALEKRREWIEKTQLDKLKERIRAFYTAYNAFYSFLINKGLVKEDPYKNEESIQIGKIHIPKTAAFSEAAKIQDLSIRLADYDNQLNILANFYPLTLDTLDFDQINLIMGLIKYIDWPALASDASSPATQAVEEVRKQVISEKDTSDFKAPASLAKLTGFILGCLKVINGFYREYYKYELRNAIAHSLPKKEAAPALLEVKNQFAAAQPSKPFYVELAEEMLKEDYSPEGPQLRKEVLKSLEAPADKPKTPASNRNLLMDGIQIIGSISALLLIIGEKFDYNKVLLEDPNPGFWGKVKQMLDKIMHKQPVPAVYEVEYTEENTSKSRGSAKVIQVKKQIVYEELRRDLEKRVRNLAAISFQGAALIKFEALPEEELLNFLERAVKGIFGLYKILEALDSYFKVTIDEKYRNKVRGIKPELSAMKNAFVKANEKSAEYTALKEAEEIRKWLPKPEEEPDNNV